MGISRRSKPDNTGQLTFLLEERPVSPSALRASGEAWMTTVVTWPLSILGWLTDCGPDGWFGRTSPASCRQTEEGILVPYSGAWANSGMGSPIERLTLSSTEWPSDGVACSLSDILETGDLPQRYFLSAKACRGILRRSENRGKTLPLALEQALQQVAVQTSEADRVTSLEP